MSADDLNSYVDAVDYAASPGAAIDLATSNSPDGARRGPCRAIRALGSGNLVVKIAGSLGQVRTLAVTTGTLETIQAISIEVGTNVATRVYW